MDPFTIAAGIGAIGSLFKGVTSLFSGNSQQAAAEAAAKQARQEGGVAAQEALQQGDQTAAVAATRAAAGGGGFSGSAMGVIQMLQQQAMSNARTAAYKSINQSRADIYQGDIAKAQGMQGLVSGVVGAASTLAGGMAQGASTARSLKALQSLGGDADATAAAGAAPGAMF